MVATKTATHNLRIDPVLKEVLRNAAAREHRSVANMVEQLIRVHCAERGIKITDLREMSPRARQD